MSDEIPNWRPEDDGYEAVYEPDQEWECRVEPDSASTWGVTLYCDGDVVSVVAEDVASQDDAKQEMIEWIADNRVILTGNDSDNE